MNQDSLRGIGCLLCQHPGKRLAESNNNFLGKKLSRKTTYYFCSSCELIYQSPLPPLSDIDSDANEGSYESFCRKEDESLEFRERNMHLYYKAIKDKMDIRRKAILEIGGGGGHHLALLKKNGAENLLGLELSRNGIRYAKERYDIKMVPDPVESLSDCSFDIIFLHQLIEHIVDPRSFLKEMKRVLRPGGQLVISTPDCMSIGRRFLRQFWGHLTFNQHLNIFSTHSLNKLLRQCDFEAKHAVPHLMYDRSRVLAITKFLIKKVLGRFDRKDNLLGTDGFLVIASSESSPKN